jgi:crotonyl-CoA carboxylase/reductase
MPATAAPSPPRYLGPPFEQAKVHDAMRVGIVSCRPEIPLRDVARMMVNYQIHSVVVADLGTDHDQPWGIVSDLDIANAAGTDLSELSARDVASTELLTVPADESLDHAAQLMAEHEITHLVAVQPETGQPIGVISALGIAAALAGGV